MLSRLLLVGAAMVLSGCAGHAYQWEGAMRDGLGGATKLVSEPGTFVTKHCPSVLREDGTWFTFSCTPVTVQAEPPGRQAHSYVYKVKIRSGYGIPYGEQAVTAYVVGDYAECQKKSEAHNMRTDGRANEGNLRLSADPAERCAGPFYIRVEGPASAERIHGVSSGEARKE